MDKERLEKMVNNELYEVLDWWDKQDLIELVLDTMSLKEKAEMLPEDSKLLEHEEIRKLREEETPADLSEGR